MHNLTDWIEAGRNPRGSKATVRRWLREARGHVPVIERLAIGGRAW